MNRGPERSANSRECEFSGSVIVSTAGLGQCSLLLRVPIKRPGAPRFLEFRYLWCHIASDMHYAATCARSRATVQADETERDDERYHVCTGACSLLIFYKYLCDSSTGTRDAIRA